MDQVFGMIDTMQSSQQVSKTVATKTDYKLVKVWIYFRAVVWKCTGAPNTLEEEDNGLFRYRVNQS